MVLVRASFFSAFVQHMMFYNIQKSHGMKHPGPMTPCCAKKTPTHDSYSLILVSREWKNGSSNSSYK